MKVCTKCKSITETEICPLCGGKKLREVQENDIVLLTSMPYYEAKIFESFLNEQHIAHNIEGQYGAAVIIGVGESIEMYNIYVYYNDYHRAEELLKALKCKNADSEF